MKYTEVRGNLFTAQCSLAHCASADMKMGKGISLQFKAEFGQVDELKKQNKKVGEVAQLILHDRRIFYLVTKKMYHGKSTYDTLRVCLEKMRDICILEGIDQIAMPRIGCGLDKLHWGIVKGIIQSVFKDTDIEILIYSL